MILCKIVGSQAVAVECGEVEHRGLSRDADGDIIFSNTHFPTEDEAFQSGYNNLEADISLVTSDLMRIVAEEARLKDKLAEKCIVLEKLKQNWKV